MSELPEIYCLGVKALGSCNYNLSNPSLSFFSIGQLATVIALLFTFSQLVKPIFKFRLLTRASPYWVPLVGIGLSILCVFTAAVLRAVEPIDLPIISYPIVWEFFAGLFLVSSGILMIFRVATKTKLNESNALQFVRHSRSILARGSADDLQEYGDEIQLSIKTVVRVCKTYGNRVTAANGKWDGSIPPTVFEEVCFTLLDLWADKQFCQILVTKCPQTAIEILLSVQNERLYESGAYAIVQELIHGAMTCPDSILHREGDYSGLGQTKSFMSAAFGNADFVKSRLRPLQAWEANSQERITGSQVERYNDAIGIALKAAIKEHQGDSFYAALITALNAVNGIAITSAWAISRIPEGEVSQSEWSRVIYECGKIHCNVISIISSLPADQQPSEQEANIDPVTYNTLKDNSIYEAVARGAYEYMESLAMCKGHDDLLRHDAISLWGELFPPDTPERPHALNAVRQRFLFSLREKVNENLDTENWYYPVVTRVLLAMWGIPDSPVDKIPTLTNKYLEKNELYGYVLSLIQQNFVAIRRKNVEYSNDLLPDKVDYVDEPPSLRQSWFRGKTTSLCLSAN